MRVSSAFGRRLLGGAVVFAASAAALASIQTVVIGDLYDGGTVNLGPGDTLEIHLTPGPACAWRPAFDDPNVLKPDAEAPAGAFRYKAQTTGSVSLGLACLSPSNPQAPAGGLFRVQVVVKDTLLPRGLLLEGPDSGSDIFMAQGELLQVRLPSTPSTGFGWSVSVNAPSVLRPLGEPKYEPPGKGGAGAAGTQTFEFRVAGGGGAFLELVYRRPFDKDAPPARRWSVFVAAAAVGP
ncbi:MAG TPA: protease inhibitor I42 family protein [Thermoanaerobaculia bacterium]|nr:protease inhibitor I42 family protein [Thermoanaerobaculia bacterium]